MDNHQAPPPPAVILNMISNIWATQAVATFARLGIPDLLANGPQSAGTLAEKCGANPDALYRLLRGVAHAGALAALPDRRFELTPVGQCLRSDVPGSMRSLLIAETAPGHWLPWGDLEHSVRTGQPATTKTLGKTVWDYYAAHKDEAFHFAEGMGGISAIALQAMIGAYTFEKADVVVDVGGSHGSLLAAALQKLPEARGVLLNLPHVVAEAGPMLKAAGVHDRVTIQGGSFFDGVPAGNLHLLKFILHDWNDDECVRILGACKKSLRPGGRVVIVEMLISDQGPPSPAPLLDLNMLVMLTGRERTADEYGALLARAGLKLSRIVPTPSPFAVIEGISG